MRTKLHDYRNQADQNYKTLKSSQTLTFHTFKALLLSKFSIRLKP